MALKYKVGYRGYAHLLRNPKNIFPRTQQANRSKERNHGMLGVPHGESVIRHQPYNNRFSIQNFFIISVKWSMLAKQNKIIYCKT